MANKQCGKTKEEIILESMTASPKIDVSIDIEIPRSPKQFNEEKHKYKCSCCGAGFTKQLNNFQKSNDVLFQANDGYLPWCKNCTDAYFSKMSDFYSKNDELAIKDFCQRAGWNYDLNALVASKDIYGRHRERSKISHYGSRRNLNCDGRKTFIDSLKNEYTQRQGEIITSKEQVKSDDINISGSAIDRWGVGFTELEYKNLDEHYRMLKRNNPNADNNQEIFIKDLSFINMLKIRCLQNGDTKEFASFVEQYSKTFKQTGLKTIEEKDSSNSDAFGVTLGLISQYTPEEFYQDKELYQDRDSIKEYIIRHIFRPIKNIITGEDERDVEYYVPENDEDE